MAKQTITHGEYAHYLEPIFGLISGILFIYLSTKYFEDHESFDVMGLRKQGGLVALVTVLAMTVHSLPEGIAIGVSFGSQNAGSHFGPAVAAAIAIHNIPEGVAISIALLSQGLSLKQCAFWCIMSSVPQVLGAVPAAYAVWAFQPLLPIGLAFAAGAMAYLILTDLIPEAYSQSGLPLSSMCMVCGWALMHYLTLMVHYVQDVTHAPTADFATM
eukprot:GFYU01006764.1.p1 GENE.GFYU01006764.1~~GFYU01006764.1.p1  ORF type:complete len:232 (-),score=53.72 GFYU01006764.1:398-1042(-)